MLKDGQWHTLEEIQQKMGVNRNQILRVVAFLKDYDFVVLDKNEEKIKIADAAMELLTQNAM